MMDNSSSNSSNRRRMVRGGSNGSESIDRSLGLGPHLVGKQISIHGRGLEICEQLGEGGFSFVYLVRNKLGGNDGGNGIEGAAAPPLHSPQHSGKSSRARSPHLGSQMVLKITAVHTHAQRQMAAKEAKLLQTLSHPSIIQVYDHGFREADGAGESSSSGDGAAAQSGNWIDGQQMGSAGGPHRPKATAQHLILMEYCEGGTAFDAIRRMKASSPSAPPTPSSNGTKMSHGFDLLSLVISFGQICNAVSYLHAQRPPIIHRDLKPVNFLIKNGAYKLCDFGSAVIGHTDLRTPEDRRQAEETVHRTTTQMFRAPEMVDLYMAKRLTQATDVWALGCCLYSLAFLRDCFEEGSNLAILSRKYRIPDDSPYGEGLADLIDRMLAGDYRERADMSEVIMCLSALYSNRPLPKRKRARKKSKEAKGRGEGTRTGAYRTDGQGIRRLETPAKVKPRKAPEAKKLNPNSAAAKRKKASEGKKRMSAPPGWGNGGSNNLSPPSSVDGEYENFASFDQVFEGGFDRFDDNQGEFSRVAPDSDGIEVGVDEFPSLFDERCHI